MQNVHAIENTEPMQPAEPAVDGVILKLSISIGVIAVAGFVLLAAILPYCIR